MLEKNVNFVEAALKKYYFSNFDRIHVPSRTSEREFGYQKFNSGMTRHLTIKNDKDLHFLLMTQVPSDVYCSNACYSFPNLPMSEKDWKEAELIFDIDAKDLKLDCRKEDRKSTRLNSSHPSISYAVFCLKKKKKKEKTQKKYNKK